MYDRQLLLLGGVLGKDLFFFWILDDFTTPENTRRVNDMPGSGKSGYAHNDVSAEDSSFVFFGGRYGPTMHHTQILLPLS